MSDSRYKNGKIYMIWSPSNSELIYIGSTIQPLHKRMAEHRKQYKRYLAGTLKTNYSSFIVIACPDARIELIECVECKDRRELCKIEGKYIRERDCVNKEVAGRTPKEWLYDNKEKRATQHQQWYQNNRQRLKAHRYQRIQCPCGILSKKGVISTHRKTKPHQDWFESIMGYRNTGNKIIVCPCGSTIRKDSLTRHKKTKKHQQYIATQMGS